MPSSTLLGWSCSVLMPSLPGAADPWFAAEVEAMPGYDHRAAEEWPEHAVWIHTLAGRGDFRTDDQRIALPPGTGCLHRHCNPRTSYGYPAEATSPWRFLGLIVRGAAAMAMCDALLAEYGAVFTPDSETPVIGRIRALTQGLSGRHTMDGADAAALVTDLFAALARSHHASTRLDPVHSAERVLRTDPTRTVAELAREVGLSREHLTRQFTARYGIAPAKYRERLLTQTACALLAQGVPGKQVAERLGFASLASFSKALRRSTGLPPSAWL